MRVETAWAAASILCNKFVSARRRDSHGDDCVIHLTELADPPIHKSHRTRQLCITRGDSCRELFRCHGSSVSGGGRIHQQHHIQDLSRQVLWF